MKRATMKNQHAKNKNARVAFTIAGGYSVPAVFAFELKNGTNSTDHNGMKRARGNIPKNRLNSNYSTCYKSALSVVHSQKMDN